MHLTNYAINKRSDNFVRDDESGSKRYVCMYLSMYIPYIRTYVRKCVCLYRNMYMYICAYIRKYPQFAIICSVNICINICTYIHMFYRKITSVMDYLEKSGYNVEKLWIRIEVRMYDTTNT